MILRADVVRERIDHLRMISLRLDEMREIPLDEFLADYEHQWAAERGLQLAAQTLLDLGAHILSGHFNLHPETMRTFFGCSANRASSPPISSLRCGDSVGFEMFSYTATRRSILPE